MDRLVKIALILALSCATLSSHGQLVRNFGVNDTVPNSGKIRLIGLGLGAGYVGSTTALSLLWYDTLGGFRFYNDNASWLQIDKIGHTAVAFHESRLVVDLLKWGGVKRKQAIWIGGLGGFIFQTPIEILDGFSPSYGASWGDLMANGAGSAMVIAQHLAWDELYIQPKFSFHRTELASLRPNTLGGSWNEEILKDYNGQTHWYTCSLYPLLKEESRYPKWLNMAIGYGAYNMVYGDPKENQANGYQSYRIWYLSPDIDLTRIPTQKKGLKIAFYLLNIFKIPAPTLEYSSENGLKGHFFYF